MTGAPITPMIEFRNVSKHYLTPHGRKVVFDDLTLTLPAGAKVGVLGRNGAGKSTLLGMIAGTCARPPARSAATPRSPGRSASRGSFHPELTGAQNVRFVARIYGIDTDGLIAYVQDFAELGDFLDMPVRTYSSGMRARLAFGMSMGIAFDWYLVDEITAVGDARFKQKSLAVFKHRLKDAGLLMASHSTEHHPQLLRPAASSSRPAGHAIFPDVEAAIAAHEANMAA